MFRIIRRITIAGGLLLGSILVGALFSYHTPSGEGDVSQAINQQDSPTPTLTVTLAETIPPYTPLATLTPSQTLKPPPTLEPPTATPTASVVPSQTPTSVTEVDVSVPGLRGAETPTPSTTPGCEPREDWQLTYTVQFDDTLSSIADQYGVWVDDLADGNCIQDKNMIVVGQVLHVPGEAYPVVPEVECVPWEVLTPFDGSVTVPADGSITFNWRGPAAPINLIRIYLPDGTVYERVIELRQNEMINLNEYLSQEGTYTWYVFPLGRDFQQIQCLEGGPWTFYKPESAAPTQEAVNTLM
ncbi:MAG: LysM peptidoglycan-binding domain-containing protein [Anaerolineae bacterium]|nr:LysM peptidoglycan-binding domain-containing protein [Anaerolineae bacterium]